MSKLDSQAKQSRVSPVVVVGGANMDVAASSDAALVRNDSNPGRIQCAPGGVARNVAENLARLGSHVQLVGVIGNDAFGDRVLEQTRQAGVDVSTIFRIPGGRTSTYLSMHGPDGDMAVAVNDMEILKFLEPQRLLSVEAVFANADLLVLDTNLDAPALDWLLGGSLNKPCFVDGVSTSKCKKIEPYLTAIQTLKLNALEANALTGVPVLDPASARLAALNLHERGVRQIVISLGAQGTAWCDADATTGYCSANVVDVVSASGAGDALLAGMVHGKLANWSFPAAVKFGMRCAEFTLLSPYSNHPELCVEAVLRR